MKSLNLPIVQLVTRHNHESMTLVGVEVVGVCANLVLVGWFFVAVSAAAFITVWTTDGRWIANWFRVLVLSDRKLPFVLTLPDT